MYCIYNFYVYIYCVYNIYICIYIYTVYECNEGKHGKKVFIRKVFISHWQTSTSRKQGGLDDDELILDKQKLSKHCHHFTS